MRETWFAIRGTVFVVAQVISLGVLAMVLGLVAINAIVSRPSPPQPTPSRQLSALVPTLVPFTPTPQPTAAEPTPTIFRPPGFSFSGTPVATSPTAQPTASPKPPEPTATAAPPPPTNTPRPQAPPTAQPAPATATPRAVATTNPTGQMMKVLPSDDGLPARVRSEPKTSAPILVRVPLGASIEVLGQANGDAVQAGNTKWWKVKWQNVTGYIYSPLLGS